MPPRPSPSIARLLDMLPAFAKRFGVASERYGALRAHGHAAAARWDWYTFHHFHLDPTFFILDECLAPGRRLKRDPKSVNGKTRYGVDSAGRVIVGETYNEFPGRCNEEFWEYGDGWIDSSLFGHQPAKDCINVARLFVTDGRADAYVAYAVSGFLVLSYEWKDGRIMRVEGCRNGFSRDPDERPLEFLDYQIDYLERNPSSVRKTVRCLDGLTLAYLISYDGTGRKKASVLKPARVGGTAEGHNQPLQRTGRASRSI